MINDRFIEFDERIHRFNEQRAGSLSMQLADTIRHLKHYPDAIQQIQINISNAEARIADLEQNASHRVEVIRSEMSRALYDHKESNRVFIDQLTARIQHLEGVHARRSGSDKSTPSRPERTQFFDISDHDGEIPRPADLPPVRLIMALRRGAMLRVHSNESLTNVLEKVVGKIILLLRASGLSLQMMILPFAVAVHSLEPEALLQSPDRKGPSRWYDAMLGRSNLIGNDASAPILHSETGTFTLAPNPSAEVMVPPEVTAPTITGVHMVVVSVDTDSALALVAEEARLEAMVLPEAVARLTVALILRACDLLVDRMEVICLVCLERQTGNPPGPNDTGFGGPKGDGSLSDAKKAKCKSFRLDAEPEPAQLRRWIVDMKERVANAFAYDPAYALSWVEIPDGTRYEDLLEECKYGMLENECNSAFRECVRSIALKNKIQTETERMHTINRRLGSRQILWLLYDFLRPHVTGDSTFKLVDLMKTTIDRFTHGSEQERLEAFSNRWDHVLAGISVDRPEDPVLCALFYEQVREFKCLELDMQLWDRDVSVRNYAYLRTVCVNAITTWRRRRNQEKMYTATRSSSAQRRYAVAWAPRLPERKPSPERIAKTHIAQTVVPEARLAKAVLAKPWEGSSCPSPTIPVTITTGSLAYASITHEAPVPEVTSNDSDLLWRLCVRLRCIIRYGLSVSQAEDRNDACVVELTLSKRSACEVFAAAVKSVKRVVAGRPDLPRVYPALPAPIIVHEKVVAAGEEPIGEMDEIGELDLDMPGVEGAQKKVPNDKKKAPEQPMPQSPPDEPRARDLREEAKSIRHLMTHLPKNPYCDACQRAKMENVKSFRQDSPRDKGFEKFGEHVTIDTMVLHGLGNHGNNGETDAVVFYDLATEWLESVPVNGRTNADTLRAFQQVFGDLKDVNSFSMDVERRYAPSAIREIYCDKAREFISTCKKVGISVKHSTPGMPRTNAIAESKVKLVLHGARVALRQAGLSAKFWPYACKHFCHARNIELRDAQSAYAQRFDGAEFDGQILPFGCLVDFFPTPARKQTRRSQKDEVVLGDGEEYALPAPDDDGMIDVEVGFDEDGFLEWVDDGEDDQPGSRRGAGTDHRLSSYQRPSKFSPTSKPGIFLGYHFENGGKWDGDYIVADLEDFKRDALRASVHQVKKIYSSPKERWTFPMLAVYDKQTRSMCINDPAMQSAAPQPSERLDASDMIDLEDIDEIFALDESRRMTDEDIRQSREAELRAESSHGGGVDYWEYDPSAHRWTYHVVVPRKAMVHPSKTPGSIGDAPDPWKLSTVRISNVQYKDKNPVTIYETGYAFGKTRLMQLWTGTVEFYDDGFAPPKKKLPPYHGSEILEGEGVLPYRQSVPRAERSYKGSRKPNCIDSESWRSMNRAEREGYVEAERREAESRAMSREDSRDAAAADIAFDLEYESGAERHDKDYWHHDVAAGTITRFHVVERRARFNPTSVKDCPVDPSTLTDVRVTMAMTDGTEFTMQVSWRTADVRSLPCRWTGKTIFVIGSSTKTQVKVRTTLPSKDGTERRVQTANGYYGHALRAKERPVIPPKARACIVTDLEFDPPNGMSARLQPLKGQMRGLLSQVLMSLTLLTLRSLSTLGKMLQWCSFILLC
ncbi:JNK [Symbiodinium sp. CCMP2592]|nr:JNK [Symbiodinium sp. CCMP2592]